MLFLFVSSEGLEPSPISSLVGFNRSTTKLKTHFSPKINQLLFLTTCLVHSCFLHVSYTFRYPFVLLYVPYIWINDTTLHILITTFNHSQFALFQSTNFTYGDAVNRIELFLYMFQTTNFKKSALSKARGRYTDYNVLIKHNFCHIGVHTPPPL